MRKNSIFLFLFALFIGQSFSAEITNFADAKEQASKLNKPLLIDFMTGW